MTLQLASRQELLVVHHVCDPEFIPLQPLELVALLAVSAHRNNQVPL